MDVGRGATGSRRGKSKEGTVLVVEDDAGLREMIQSMIEDLVGLKTTPAEDGVTALQLAAKWPPALVLLDIMLPGVDGLEVARRLRQNPATQHVPIIAVTAGTSRQSALDAGCDDYLAKPFDVDSLLRKVGAYLRPEMRLALC